MPLARRRLALACLLGAIPLRAFGTEEPDTTGGGSLAGQLLVAAPEMNDPRFVKSVILMIQHGIGGAMGLAINRPIGEKSLADLLRAIGEDPGKAQGSLTVFAGGPVDPTAGFVVHSGDYHLPDTIRLDQGVAISPPRPVLHDIGGGHGPQKRLLIIGYAGWAPEQLEAELSLRVWVSVPAAPDLVFDIERSKVWQAALARRTVPL
jgi:putative transcriptional regulator